MTVLSIASLQFVPVSIGWCSNLSSARVRMDDPTAERLLKGLFISIAYLSFRVEGDSRPGPEPNIFSDLSRMLGDSVRRSQVCPVKNSRMLLVKQELLAALANTLESFSPGAGRQRRV